MAWGVKPVAIEVFTDASWADLDDRSSVTGGLCIFLHEALVIYYSRRQRSITTPSSEAEYVAIAAGVKSLRWLRQLLDEVKENVPKATIYTASTVCPRWVIKKMVSGHLSTLIVVLQFVHRTETCYYGEIFATVNALPTPPSILRAY
mmetsp:Transcript_40659/g.161230  ORF Transcript_40659/g.161230 Transcript_40659/m.161230 type:complete len:147 (+) Transcript_40659:176-616(+)